jgi:hypothetical protein
VTVTCPECARCLTPFEIVKLWTSYSPAGADTLAWMVELHTHRQGSPVSCSSTTIWLPCTDAVTDALRQHACSSVCVTSTVLPNAVARQGSDGADFAVAVSVVAERVGALRVVESLAASSARHPVILMLGCDADESPANPAVAGGAAPVEAAGCATTVDCATTGWAVDCAATGWAVDCAAPWASELAGEG